MFVFYGHARGHVRSTGKCEIHTSTLRTRLLAKKSKRCDKRRSDDKADLSVAVTVRGVLVAELVAERVLVFFVLPVRGAEDSRRPKN